MGRGGQAACYAAVMQDHPQDASHRGRVVWLVLLVAWMCGAVVAFVVIAWARSDLRAALDQMPPSHLRSVLRGWTISLRFCQVLLVVLVLLAVWAAVLLFRRQPHPRQWATILVFAALVAIGWLLFAGLGAPLDGARRFIGAEQTYGAQLLVGAGALLLSVLAVVRVRRAPEPLEPTQDRYHIASYSQFNKTTPGAGDALAEARSRAESVLPVNDPEG